MTEGYTSVIFVWGTVGFLFVFLRERLEGFRGGLVVDENKMVNK